MVTRSGNVQNSRGGGGLTRSQQQRGGAALERGDALFCHILGGVHDAGVDVSELSQGEKGLCVVGTVKDVGRSAVNRGSP